MGGQRAVRGARKAPPLRVKLMLLVLGPAVFFGLLELSLRIGGFRYEPWARQREVHRELLQREIYEPHPDLLWTLPPSTTLDLPLRGFPGIPINSHGLRGGELPGPGATDELRILCLGDSVTFGLHRVVGQSWPDHLQAALRAAPETAGRVVRVINGAVPGWSSVQGLRLLEQLGDVEIDVIVFWFGMNDSQPMRQLPDSMLKPAGEGPPRVLSMLRELRSFQLVQRVVTNLRQAVAEGSRVSRAEFRAGVQDLLDRERAGGPRVIFVRSPERCSTTIAQLEQVVARAEELGVDLVVAPRRLLHWIVPAPEGADLQGHRTVWHGRPAVLFEPSSAPLDYLAADLAKPLAEVRADLELIRGFKATLDRLLEELPEDSLDGEDLFGDSDPDSVFYDNCHLRPLGTQRVGEAMAREMLEVLRSAPR